MKSYRKILFGCVLFLFTFGSNSYSEVVNEIKVKGNERITLDTISIFGDITVGKDYNSPDINLIIKKLYDSTFFSNISVELENGILTVTVEETPIINNVVFKGEKAKKYQEAISELLTLREKTSFRDAFIKSDINIT